MSTNSGTPVGKSLPIISTFQAPQNINISSTTEEQLENLSKLIEGLKKCAHEQDAKKSKLTYKMSSMIRRRSNLSPLKIPKIQDVGYSCLNKTKTKEIHICDEGLLWIVQLKDFIIVAMEDKFESSSKFSPTYAKPYVQKIDNLKMHEAYQPPKIQKFDRKGNPKNL